MRSWESARPPGPARARIPTIAFRQLPADKLRAVNLALEQSAWGAFETEFFPTYDFQPVWQGIRSRAKGG